MKRMPKSIRKHIRREKARIRRECFSLEEQEKKLKELLERFIVPSVSAKSSAVSSGAGP